VRKLIAGTIAALVCGLLAAQALAATRSVTIGDDFFVRKGSPPTVTVKRGTTVRWVWRGDNPHNVTVRRGPVKFHSSVKESGTYSRTVRRVGTYRIVCSVHQPDMRMTLKVTR
jgi:plastocyanin